MENLSIKGEEQLASQNKKLEALLAKAVREMKDYSESQFGDSAKTSAIYQMAREIEQDFLAIYESSL